MKTWKIITVLLAVLLLAGSVGCVSGATINSITLSLDAPETGEKVTSATSSTSGVKVTTTWNPAASGTFDAEKTYTATITVEPSSSSNTFAGTGTIKLNGNAKSWNVVDGKIIITHTFSKTVSATTTSAIELTLTKPLAANAPVTTATVSKPTKGIKTTVTWSPNHKKFELGTKYTATVVIESTNVKAYPIASDATVKVNGDKVTSLTRDGNSKITLTYAFGETEPKGTADVLDFTITAPVVGKTPSSGITVNKHSDKVKASLAWSTTSAFEPDIPYTATITVTANEGYVIKSTATATVNGNAAVIVWESNTRATVTYTFAQIASVDDVRVSFIAPKTGEAAQTAANAVTTTPSGAASSASIKWAPELTEGAFDAGIEYTATVTIPISGANMVFDKNTAVYINGEPAQVTVSSDYKTITAVYTFPKTMFIPNPIEIIKEFYNLMLAIFNPASYKF